MLRSLFHCLKIFLEKEMQQDNNNSDSSADFNTAQGEPMMKTQPDKKHDKKTDRNKKSKEEKREAERQTREQQRIVPF